MMVREESLPGIAWLRRTTDTRHTATRTLEWKARGGADTTRTELHLGEQNEKTQTKKKETTKKKYIYNIVCDSSQHGLKYVTADKNRSCLKLASQQKTAMLCASYIWATTLT